VSSEMLLNKMSLFNKKIMSKEQLFEWAEKTTDKLIVMAGAGDIDVCITKVQEIFTNKA
jgi:UDP-N-acetylmuramate--alanine ligase